MRLPPQSPYIRWIAALAIACGAAITALALRILPPADGAFSLLDDTFYDAFYRQRPAELRTQSDIVIIAVDDKSLTNLKKQHRYWPWPRDYWGILVNYVQTCGARAVAFDWIFREPSNLAQFMDDDSHFAHALDSAKIPVVMGSVIGEDGTPDPFAIPVTRPATIGAVNILTDKVVRDYLGTVHGVPSLAMQVAVHCGATVPTWGRESFRLHYYGPNVRPDGQTTYSFISAANVFADASFARKGLSKQLTIDPDFFKGKVVLIGAISAGLYDLKASPLSNLYPGVEVQATAIDNLLNNQHVIRIPPVPATAISFVFALLAAIAVIGPRKVQYKLFGALLACVLLLATSVLLFRGVEIRWLPMSAPLLALLFSTLGAFAWTYLIEERRRRAVLKALSQYVSPHVADELARDPSKLRLGGQRRDMTVMFSDIKGFTTLSETLSSEDLSTLLNFYLGEMSDQILANDGTIDKYIGDATMSFWNAPLLQADHAARACRAALAMRGREAEMQPKLNEMGAPGLMSRIGINTGPMVFGNMGSARKFNYTVLGDSVNLGSRLEGANKFYDSRILIAGTTAELVRDQFLLRQLDVLRVSGKKVPMAVYELLVEGEGDESLRNRATQYELALRHYRTQRWDDAISVLKSLLEWCPYDGPAVALLNRVGKLQHNPPAPDWDGVYVATDK